MHIYEAYRRENQLHFLSSIENPAKAEYDILPQSARRISDDNILYSGSFVSVLAPHCKHPTFLQEPLHLFRLFAWFHISQIPIALINHTMLSIPDGP